MFSVPPRFTKTKTYITQNNLYYFEDVQLGFDSLEKIQISFLRNEIIFLPMIAFHSYIHHNLNIACCYGVKKKTTKATSQKITNTVQNSASFNCKSYNDRTIMLKVYRGVTTYHIDRVTSCNCVFRWKNISRKLIWQSLTIVVIVGMVSYATPS